VKVSSSILVGALIEKIAAEIEDDASRITLISRGKPLLCGESLEQHRMVTGSYLYVAVRQQHLQVAWGQAAANLVAEAAGESSVGGGEVAEVAEVAVVDPRGDQLRNACQFGDEAPVRTLLEAGIDANTDDAQSLACILGSTSIFRLLLENGSSDCCLRMGRT
jgi:hypothetical protein